MVLNSFGEIREATGAGQTIVFVSGNFNILHPGHIRLLDFAAQQGDVIVVGLQPDSNRGVTVTAGMRLDMVRAHTHVKHVLLMTQPIEQVIAELRPDVVVKGKEFEDRVNPEAAAVEAYGGKLIFGSGEVRFSSIELIRDEYRTATLSTIVKPTDYPQRRGFTLQDFKGILDRISGLRMLVIGDLIVDTYIDCEALGMSQEEPTIVLSPLTTRTFVGGAGIVGLHARGLGAEVNFVTVAGGDARSDFVSTEYEKYGASCHIVTDATRPTTHKTRYRAGGKSLLRVNELRQHAIEPAIMDEVLATIDRLLPQTDLLLFSDFNYGCLPQPLVDAIVERASARGIMMMADSQASSQLSDISRFQGMTLVTPTEREVRLAMQDFDAGLAHVSERLQEKAACKHLFVTLGAEGLLIYGFEDGVLRPDRLPAFNTAPKDVAGAGDSLFTAASLAICSGVDIWRSAYLGSLAAACQTSRVGNLPLTVDDIIAEIDFPDFHS